MADQKKRGRQKYKNLNILRRKRAFHIKIKIIFHNFLTAIGEKMKNSGDKL